MKQPKNMFSDYVNAKNNITYFCCFNKREELKRSAHGSNPQKLARDSWQEKALGNMKPRFKCVDALNLSSTSSPLEPVKGRRLRWNHEQGHARAL